MPTYDYVCTVCGHQMEVVHSIHGHGPAACPRCGGAMKKAFSAPAVVFKGSGWARKERHGRRPKPSPEKSEATDKTSSSESGSGTASSSDQPKPAKQDAD